MVTMSISFAEVVFSAIKWTSPAHVLRPGDGHEFAKLLQEGHKFILEKHSTTHHGKLCDPYHFALLASFAIHIILHCGGEAVLQ